MKKVLRTGFLLFYTAFTVAAVSQHTAASASTFIRNASPESKTMRTPPPRSFQGRVQEDPYVGFRVTATFALAETGTSDIRHSAPAFVEDSYQLTPSRAPPALL